MTSPMKLDMSNIIKADDTLSEADDETSESDCPWEQSGSQAAATYDLKLELLEKHGIDIDGLIQAGVELTQENKALVLESARLEDELEREQEHHAANIVKIKQAQNTYANELVQALRRIATLEKLIGKMG